GERRTRVDEAARRNRPRLLGEQVAHVSPRIERLGEGGKGAQRMGPAEVGQIVAQPDLQRLRRDGLHVLYHRTPARVAGDDLAADMWNRTDPNTEHNEVEVIDHAQRLGTLLSLIPVRLEIPSLPLEPLAVDQLRVVGLCRPARQPADIDQRPVLGAALHLRSYVELESLDIRLLRRRQPGGIRELDVLEAVEELEADAALFE